MSCGAQSSKMLIMVFWVTSPHPGGIRSPLKVTSLEQKTLLYDPRTPKGFRTLGQELGGETKNRAKDALRALITQEIKRVLGTLFQEVGEETNTYIFYYFTAHPLASGHKTLIAK